jgi:hypothetical protein
LLFEKRRIAVSKVVGPYKRAHTKIAAVEQQLSSVRAIDWSKEACVGFYYDNPTTTKEEDCRALVGKIIPDDFEERPLDGVIYGTLGPFKNSVQIRYPLRSMWSFIVGIPRAYSALGKWSETEGSGKEVSCAIELYGYHGANITFMRAFNEFEGFWKTWPN